MPQTVVPFSEYFAQAITAKPIVEWRKIARPEQLRPEGCREFIIKGGRGSGKTRAGAEDMLELCRKHGKGFIAHATSPTVGDAIKVLMDGPSGVKACAHPGEIVKMKYDKSNLIFELKNGAMIHFFGMDEEDRLNGPQCHYWWSDEFGLTPVASLDMANLGNRLKPSYFCGTSTPKQRPGTKHITKLFPDATVRRVSMYDNADNLDAPFIAAVERAYGGTRIGRAEIHGEDVEETQGALWKAAWFDRSGFRFRKVLNDKDGGMVFEPPLGVVRAVVALDPTVSDPEKKKNPHKEPDACGIIVAGIDHLSNGYVLADYTQILAPGDWARLAVALYQMCNCSGIIAEKNQGGELIREVLKGVDPTVPIHLVSASMGKRPRAEPVALLYEQGKVFHCGELRDLEDQMLNWDAEDPSAKSPNNIDALVWAFHGLGLCRATGMRVQNMLKTTR